MGCYVESGGSYLKFRPMEERDWRVASDWLKIVETEHTYGMVCESTTKDIVLGIVVYDSFSEDSCHMHHILIEPFILTQGWGELVFGLPFEQYKFNKVFGTVPDWNTKALAFCKELGFKEVAFIPEYWGKVGCHYLRLDKADCTFLGDSDGRWQRRK